MLSCCTNPAAQQGSSARHTSHSFRELLVLSVMIDTDSGILYCGARVAACQSHRQAASPTWPSNGLRQLELPMQSGCLLCMRQYCCLTVQHSHGFWSRV